MYARGNDDNYVSMCCYNIIQKEQLLLRQDDGDTEDAAEMTPNPRPAIVVATSCDRSLPRTQQDSPED